MRKAKGSGRDRQEVGDARLLPRIHGGDDRAWPHPFRTGGCRAPGRFPEGQGAFARDPGDDDRRAACPGSVPASGYLRTALPPIADGAAASGTGQPGRSAGRSPAPARGAAADHGAASATGSAATGAASGPGARGNRPGPAARVGVIGGTGGSGRGACVAVSKKTAAQEAQTLGSATEPTLPLAATEDSTVPVIP